MRSIVVALLLVAAPAPAHLTARAAGGQPLALLVSRTATAWTVTVPQTGQRITAAAEDDRLPNADPILLPLAGPETDDLLLPVATGMVNLVWDVWLQDARTHHLTAAGQVSGVGVVRDRSGAIVSLSRDSCCAWVYSVFHVTPRHELVNVLDITATLGPGGSITGCEAKGEPDAALAARLCRIGAQADLPK